MKRRFGRTVLAGGLLATVFLTMAVSASASLTVLCVRAAANGVVKGPTTVGGSECKAGYSKVSLPSSEELEVLNKVMPHVKYQEKGIGGKPTIQFSGVNVELVNGEGKTASVNGEGNLVIGYDENAGRMQTGSHDLILGEEQAFTSFGGMEAGFGNAITGREASVTGGALNTASGFYTSISGGMNNTASVEAASVQGGSKNLAQGKDASIFGGKELVAKNEYEAIP